MEHNLKGFYIVGAILLVCFAAACICIAMQTSQVQDLKEQVATAQALELAQDAYVRGVQSRLEESQKRAAQAELTLTLITEACSSECSKTCWTQE